MCVCVCVWGGTRRILKCSSIFKVIYLVPKSKNVKKNMKIVSSLPSRYLFIPQVLLYDQKLKRYFILFLLLCGQNHQNIIFLREVTFKKWVFKKNPHTHSKTAVNCSKLQFFHTQTYTHTQNCSLQQFKWKNCS